MLRREGKKEEEAKGAPGWMVTYGDLMSLLLTFFVLIASFSSIELAKFKQAIGSFLGALGVLESDRGRITYSETFVSYQSSLNRSLEQLSWYIYREGLQNMVSVYKSKEGVRIRIGNPLLFELGRAEVKPKAREFLREIAFMLADLPCEVIVEGHTDDLPIHTDKFPSNWELSAVRAVNVVKVLMEYGIPPSRLAAVGYGEFRPLKPNDSEQHRAMNRRAEILIRWLEEGYE
ncbi:MAG: hypothetical protein DRP99_03410 [Candidatus Latescibacterota bacterium]|nr:MAG: hypothetical protein DRP99_03410 [Candidatus Latescibacterota bacterium]